MLKAKSLIGYVSIFSAFSMIFPSIAMAGRDSQTNLRDGGVITIVCDRAANGDAWIDVRATKPSGTNFLGYNFFVRDSNGTSISPRNSNINSRRFGFNSTTDSTNLPVVTSLTLRGSITYADGQSPDQVSLNPTCDRPF